MNTPSLNRIVAITPAYDCLRNQPCVHGSDKCKPGSGGNHGIHNCELHMTVQGPTAEVMLSISTGWDLPTVPTRTRLPMPSGRFVEFHTAAPMYKGQEQSLRVEVPDDAVCKPWDRCYSDRGYTMADEPTALLVAEGSEAVWKWLEAQHDDVVVKMLDLQ